MEVVLSWFCSYMFFWCCYVQVKHESSTAVEDNWCWEKPALDLDIVAEDKKGIVFVQKGYWITISSTHDVSAYIHQPDASLLDIKIKVYLS